jgi:cytochrome c biogenesis protein CcdA/glutaredoxin
MKKFIQSGILAGLLVFGVSFLPGLVFADGDEIETEDSVMMVAPHEAEIESENGEVLGIQEEKQGLTPVTIFFRDDCGHCHDAMNFLTPLAEERGDFELIVLDLDEETNRDLFDELVGLESLTQSTPILLVGNTVIQGFATPETTGVMIESLLDASKDKETMDLQEYLAAGGTGGSVETVQDGTCDLEGCEYEEPPFLVNIPFFGALDVKKFSLPAMALVLGFIDGFNPCAMWVLVTFLIVLMQIGDRKKMWQIAGLFIAAEAIMYYLILNVWFSAWDFIGLDRIVTPIIGLLAIGGGIFFLWEWKQNDGTCKVTNSKQRTKIQTKIKEIADKPMTLVTAGGVIALALSVNIIEFACSIGIPQAFTKIIEINALSWLHTQFLMLLYIMTYMVDDLIVFGLALWGAQYLALSTKYTRWSNLIGGILMLLLGALLVFAPDLLRL